MPGRYVTGVQAVLRRVLYGWLLPPVLTYDPTYGAGLLLYDGATLGPSQILGLRRQLESLAIAEDYVRVARVLPAMDNRRNALVVPAEIGLVDGRAYPLEVTIDAAGAALDAMGI
jgi:hypothetical protein